MYRASVWLVLFITPRIVYGVVTPSPLQRGFEQNVGQYGSDILFALDYRVLYRNRVQLIPDISMQFANGNPFAVVSGQAPKPYPLNLYIGPDPKRWRENVSHFGAVRYAQIYPGIDLECNTFNQGDRLPAFRFIVSPGANPQLLIMNLLAKTPPILSVYPDRVIVTSENYFTIQNLVAFQTTRFSKSYIAVKFIQISENSFRPEVGVYEASLPLNIEFGNVVDPYFSKELIAVGYDNSVFSGGSYWGDVSQRSFVAKWRLDGTIAFLTMFDHVHHNNSLTDDGYRSGWLFPDRKGTITIAGSFGPRVEYNSTASPPVTPDAPRSKLDPDSDGWIGRFDSDGRLISATYTGGLINAVILDPNSSVYFSTAESVIKWIPRESKFAFAVPVKNVIALAANQKDQIAFAATGSEGLPTTAGAYNSRYQGPWTQYLGRLDAFSGAVQMATYVSVIGTRGEEFQVHASLALSPNGSLWLASGVDFGGYPSAIAHTLVAVSSDGGRMLNSESIPFFPSIAFDPDGNVLVAAITDSPNSPTSLDAPIRVPCLPYSLYVAKRTPEGGLLYATYVSPAGWILVFDGLDRLLVYSSLGDNNILRIDISRPAPPGIACMISPATRRPLISYSQGELVTISGSQLGPLQPVNAAVDSNGNLPTQLAGVQVLVNRVAMPLVSAQKGMITFYIPEETLGGHYSLEVLSGETPIASTSIQIEFAQRFALFTADGFGSRGLAAAINQDGTLNSEKSAPTDSVVALLGIGSTPPPIGLTPSFKIFLSGVPVVVEDAGPAPGLVPGIKQIKIRMPKEGFAANRLVHGFAQINILPGPPKETPQYVYLNVSQ